MRLRRRDPNPGTPHEFRSIEDPGIAAVASGGTFKFGGTGGLTAVVTTDNFIRKSRCGVPGCGLERTDPIHHGGEA
jgi:hypothetical protein